MTVPVRSQKQETQKRYRERQKAKRDEIADQVSVLTRRLADMQSAHDSLAMRNKVLERFAELSEARESVETVESKV